MSLAKKYDIRIKFTLQHIRTIQPDGRGAASWANRAFMAVENGGPFKNIHDYINTPEGKKVYLNRVKALSERYKDNKQIFSWELWNEMDAVDAEEWHFSSNSKRSLYHVFKYEKDRLFQCKGLRSLER